MSKKDTLQAQIGILDALKDALDATIHANKGAELQAASNVLAAHLLILHKQTMPQAEAQAYDGRKIAWSESRKKKHKESLEAFWAQAKAENRWHIWFVEYDGAEPRLLNNIDEAAKLSGKTPQGVLYKLAKSKDLGGFVFQNPPGKGNSAFIKDPENLQNLLNAKFYITNLDEHIVKLKNKPLNFQRSKDVTFGGDIPAKPVPKSAPTSAPTAVAKVVEEFVVSATERVALNRSALEKLKSRTPV
jgi:hypothetical protein